MFLKIKSLLKKPYTKFVAPLLFPGTKKYWEKRYTRGGNSGEGSYGKLAEYKAEIINNFVLEHSINSVIEFGCGDGNQLAYANYHNYFGYDISKTVISLCKERFKNNPNYEFALMEAYHGEKAELSLSLDVIYHLIEDELYEEYMQRLFNAAERFVIIYSSNYESETKFTTHVKPHKFSNWISVNRPNWILIKHIPNKYKNLSFADFYIYMNSK